MIFPIASPEDTSGRDLWVVGLASFARAHDLKRHFGKHGKVCVLINLFSLFFCLHATCGLLSFLNGVVCGVKCMTLRNVYSNG